ncbi:hypothetical protein, partial [Neglectibacter sp. 59]|uniref:hypothetical protein n=1 Tax=Neglectibacter sp. 59 TaxID=2304573 RepID=UPI001A9AE643
QREIRYFNSPKFYKARSERGRSNPSSFAFAASGGIRNFFEEKVSYQSSKTFLKRQGTEWITL